MRVGFEAVTDSLGPGCRYAIWVQGCPRRCKGCINPAGWSMNGGTERSIDDLFLSISKSGNLTGISVSGGEPFLQFEELCKLIYKIKAETSLDVMVYSGFTVEELERRFGSDFLDLKGFIDIFVDGEYVEALNTGSMYRGSDNQRIFFFTQKYRRFSEKILNSKKRSFSFDVRENGDVYFVGIPPVGFYEKFLQKIGDVK